MKKTKVWGLSLITFLIIVFCILAIFFIPYPPHYVSQQQYWSEKAIEVDKHQRLWSEQKIAKYKIGIRFFGLSEGLQEFVINHNAVAEVIMDTCGNCGFETIDDLFSYVERINKARRCGSNGCDCDGPYVMEVVYDKEYNFPRIAHPINDRGVRWMFMSSKSTGGCTLLGDLGIGWEVYSFLPVK